MTPRATSIYSFLKTFNDSVHIVDEEKFIINTRYRGADICLIFYVNDEQDFLSVEASPSDYRASAGAQQEILYLCTTSHGNGIIPLLNVTIEGKFSAQMSTYLEERQSPSPLLLQRLMSTCSQELCRHLPAVKAVSNRTMDPEVAYLELVMPSLW